MSVPTLTKTGTKATSAAKLSSEVFGIEVTNHELVRLAYEGYSADQRTSSAVTKTRGLVRGGGRKPWRQKGTGRARFGSIRNPIWKGGGIVFGPTGNENYSTKLNKKAKAEAMRQALSLKNAANKLVVIEGLPGNGKTSDLSKLSSKISEKGTIVFVDTALTPELQRACNNIPTVSLVSAAYLNVKRVIDADVVVLTKEAVSSLEKRLGGRK